MGPFANLRVCPSGLIQADEEASLTFRDIWFFFFVSPPCPPHSSSRIRNRVGGLKAVFTALSKTGSFSEDW